MGLFPPPPANADLERLVISVFSDLDPGFYYWQPLVSSRHDSWIGVHFESVKTPERRWHFDVIDSSYGLQLPLSLNVAPDILVAAVSDPSRDYVRGKLSLDYSTGPRELIIPKSVIPPEPWKLELSLTWSSEAVNNIMVEWLATKVRRDDLCALPRSPDKENITFAAGEHIRISDEYMDFALTLPPDDAAVIIGTLSKLAEFIAGTLA